MQLEHLRVLHLPKSRIKNLPGDRPTDGVFYLETCQRLLWISNSKDFSKCPLETPGSLIYQGHQAYLFLLRLAAGLESEVLGETDIFGQVKESWRKSEQLGTLSELQFWIQRLFEDTKEIRSRFLQNMGGSSYGTLVRKLIKDQKGSLAGPLLLVGAGQVAHAIAPLLLDFDLILTNRNPDRLSELCNQLSKRTSTSVTKILNEQEEIQAWKTAGTIVVCIPFDSVQDAARMKWFRQGSSSNRLLIHLGGMKKHSGSWSELSEFYCLDDLFGLQNTLGKARSLQIAYAERACEERAKLRSLGASLSISHGWEDLAWFA